MDYINNIINKYLGTNEGFYYFIKLIKEKYPTFKINENNLKTLIIEEMSNEYFLETGFVGEYVAKENKIKILKFVDIDDKSIKFSEIQILETFLHELLHAITTIIDNDNQIILEGINSRMISNNLSSFFLAINEGITQYIVNDMLNLEFSDAYIFETNIAKQLALIIGKDLLIKYYSNNNQNEFIQHLKNINPELKERDFVIIIYLISSVLNNMNDVFSNDNDKQLARYIQEQLIKLYLNSDRIDDEKFKDLIIDETLADLIVNPNEILKSGRRLNIENYGFKNIGGLKDLFLKIINKSGETFDKRKQTKH